MSFLMRTFLYLGAIFAVVPPVLPDKHSENQLRYYIAQDEIVSKIKPLIEGGVDINFPYEDGQRLIHVAVEKDYTEIIRLLADSGANLTARNNEGYTPLHIAVLRDNMAIIDTLIEKNANVNIQDNLGRTPLNISIALGQRNTVEYLIQHGADVSQNLREWEQAALGCALRFNSTAYDALNENNATLTSRWQPILKTMIIEDNINATVSLIKMCPVNSLSIRGPFLLHLSAEMGREQIATILIQNGANVNAINNERRTPLFNTTFEVAKILIEKGANVNIQDSTNSTPLHIAAQEENVDMLEFLIRSGANINAKDVMNQTPLHMAAKNGRYKITKALMRNAADVSMRTINGSTPLHIAAKNGYGKVSEELIQHGADLDSKNDDGYTPVQLAILNDKINCLEILVKNNASVNIHDSDGRSPLNISIALGQRNTIEYLIEHGADVPQNLKEWEQAALGCALQDNANAIDELTKKNVTLTFEWERILHKLISEGNINATVSLIEICAVNLTAIRDLFSLHLAAELAKTLGRDKIATILKQNGANVNTVNNDEFTPLLNTTLKISGIESVCQNGFFNDKAKRPEDCISCFCFGVSTQCISAKFFTYALPPPVTSLTVVGVHGPWSGQRSISINVFEKHELLATRHGIQFRLANLPLSGELPYYSLPRDYLGNQLKLYGGKLKYYVEYSGRGNPNDAPDIIITGNGNTLIYRHPNRIHDRIRNSVSVLFVPGEWYSPDGHLVSREEIMMILVHVDFFLIRLQYIDTVQRAVELHHIVMDLGAVTNQGLDSASLVEECRCLLGYSGLSCETCTHGYTRHEIGDWLGLCIRDEEFTLNSI